MRLVCGGKEKGLGHDDLGSHMMTSAWSRKGDVGSWRCRKPCCLGL